MKLKPWYDVVKPREDLRENKPLDASEFAVHLDKVRLGHAPAGDLMHDDPSRDDGQVRGERTVPAKPPQHVEFARHDRQENVSGQVVDIMSRQLHAASRRRVLDDMHEHAGIAVDELLPRTGFPVEAVLQQTAVVFGQCHNHTLPS